MTTVVRIRREATVDVDAIGLVHDLAFGNGDGSRTWEARLVDDLRASASWIPALSLVAEVDGVVVGHVLATRGRVERAGQGAATPALGLAPLGVLPDRHRLGVGTRLMYALIGAMQALDEQLVCLLGDPAYYRRFGFVPASTHGIEPPDPRWAPHFQALPLGATGWSAPPGTFRYDPAFDRPA